MNRSPRAGVTLVEIMVVVAIVSGVMAIAIPTLSNVLQLQQLGAARDLAMTWRLLRDEAVLRNVTFRFAFNLDAGTWKVEMGDANALVFATPDELKAWEESQAERLARYTKREAEEGEIEDSESSRYVGLDVPGLEMQQELPSGTVFASVWTPQYDEPQEPTERDEDEELAEEDQRVVYAYVFPNGFCEPAIVRMADEGDPEDGTTIVVEPLTGEVRLEDQAIDPESVFGELDIEPPELSL